MTTALGASVNQLNVRRWLSQLGGKLNLDTTVSLGLSHKQSPNPVFTRDADAVGLRVTGCVLAAQRQLSTRQSGAISLLATVTTSSMLHGNSALPLRTGNPPPLQSILDLHRTSQTKRLKHLFVIRKSSQEPV